MAVLDLPWPKPAHDARRVLPIFLPYAACPQRCIFCAQDTQSNTSPQRVDTALTTLRHTLDARKNNAMAPVELAFYGGTFTALPEQELSACLTATRTALDQGMALSARCSTRPDALCPDVLHTLRRAGFDTVELGIQSFHTQALHSAQRGYDADTALRACAMVRAAGLRLGVQLMPGMPGVSHAIFLKDVRTALTCGAQLLRFYPCQVLEGTPLAASWRKGAFIPWTLNDTIVTLAKGWLLAYAARVPVIRMGLAPEEGLTAHTLAGPTHPALGALVQGTALHSTVAHAVHRHIHRPLRALYAPRWVQGHFWGHCGALREHWAALGITQGTMFWHTRPALHMYYS